MRWPRTIAKEAAQRSEERLGASGLERKYRIALVLYAVLAVLVWFTMGEGDVLVFGRQVEIRWIPTFVVASFAFRTVMAMQADRIRRNGE